MTPPIEVVAVTAHIREEPMFDTHYDPGVAEAHCKYTMEMFIEPSLNIYNYIDDGFVKIADVEMQALKRKYYKDPTIWQWKLINQNEDFLYMDHRSWVYFIVDGQQIVKIGETGNPLGIRSSRSDQPLKGTKCRFGRLISHGDGYGPGDTDGRIRRELRKSAEKGDISLWARRCEFIETKEVIAGKKQILLHSSHKDLETAYLDHIYRETGSYPRCNVFRK